MKYVPLVLVLMLAGCGGTTPPAEATVNGVTSLDRETGKAELSVSGLDAAGQVVASGTVSDVSATVETVDGIALAQASPYTVSGEACGDITALGPITAALTFDASGSLGTTDPTRDGTNVRREGGLAYVRGLVVDEQAAISYFEGATDLETVQPFVPEKALLEQAVVAATDVRGSRTPLWAASQATVTLLGTVTGTNKVAVIFTDGGDNASGSIDPEDVTQSAQTAEVRVFMIGLGEGATRNVDAMTDIASQTNGLYVGAEDASQLADAFTRNFNASRAAGCVSLDFDPTPAQGQALGGTVSFGISGRTFTGDYAITF